MELAQENEVVLDGVAALDPDEDAGLAVVAGRRRLLGREDEGQAVRVLSDQAADRFDLGEDLVGRLEFLLVVRRRRGEAGEDLEVDAAALELGDVDVSLGQVLAQVLAGHGPGDGVAVHVDDGRVAVEEKRPMDGVEEVLAARGQLAEDVAVILAGFAQALGVDQAGAVAGHVVLGVLVVEHLGQDLAAAEADGRHVLGPERGVVRAAVVRPGLEPGDRLRVEAALDDLEELGELGHAADEKIAVARPDHVDVHVEDGLVERDRRVLGVVARALEPELLAGPGAEDDGPGRLEAGLVEGPGRLEHDRRRGGVVVRAGVDPAVDADAEVVEVAAHDEGLALELGVGPGQDADDVRGRPLAGDEVGLHLGLDAEVERERPLEAERLADEVPPAFADEIERVVEEIASGPHDDEALGALARREHAGARPPLARLAGFARRREVHLDEADGALVGRGLDLLLEGPGGLGLVAERVGEVGQDQDDLAFDVDRGVIVPAVLLRDDAVAGEGEPAADDARARAADGREVAAAAGEIDAMRGRQDLEADGLLEVRPGLERDLLEPGAVVAARLEAGLFHLGGHVLGGPAVFGSAGLPALELVRGEESDVGEGLRAVGRRAGRRPARPRPRRGRPRTGTGRGRRRRRRTRRTGRRRGRRGGRSVRFMRGSFGRAS